MVLLLLLLLLLLLPLLLLLQLIYGKVFLPALRTSKLNVQGNETGEHRRNTKHKWA
jgi:hypothetical protein